MTEQEIISRIPHDIRVKILESLPAATATLSNPAFQFLWEAFFIYVDPDAVKSDWCPLCLNNVLKNWTKLSEGIAKAVKEYNTFEQLYK